MADKGRVPDAGVMMLAGSDSIVDAAIDIIVTFNAVNHGAASDPAVYRKWTAFKVFDTANSIVKSFTTKKP